MYPNLLKKLKKEVGERQNASLQHIHQLLPIPRLTTEVIAVEAAGSITNSKGNKISFDSTVDNKHDLQVGDNFDCVYESTLIGWMCFRLVINNA